MTESRLLKTLRIRNFRNLEGLDREFKSGFTIVSGMNAQGKTNLLESIYWISTTKLLRGQRDLEAVRHGSTDCRVEVELQSGTSLTATLELGSRKKFAINGMGLGRASDILGRLPSVVISMADLEIVRGDPSERRLFLDLELSALFPQYLVHLAHYRRALDQRNALLKRAQESFVDEFAFEMWEEPLATHGSELRRFRQEYLAGLEPTASFFQSELGVKDEILTLTYAPKDQGSLLENLRNNRRGDIQRGTTQWGPHRDDLAIMINDIEARLYGSQGQQRSAVISLKFATLLENSKRIGMKPLLLLDDMLSDLDPSRRASLCRLVCEHADQAILTCTDAESAGNDILARAEVVTICSGRLA